MHIHARRNIDGDLSRVPGVRYPLGLGIVSVAFLALLGCTDEPPAVARDPVALIDHSAWMRVQDAEDPFASLRRPDHMCRDPGFLAEYFGATTSIQIWTGECNFITLTQPSLEAVEAGAEIEIRLWYFPLTSPDPGEAYLAFWSAGNVLWERTVSIPTETGALLDDVVQVPVDLPAGEPLVFHLNNHGINTYNLLEVQAL